MDETTNSRLREHPSERFADPQQPILLDQEIHDLLNESAHLRHGHREKALFRHGPMTVALFCLDPGAHLPNHVVPGDVIIQVLRGEVTIRTDSTTHELTTGHLLALKPNVAHDLTAKSKCRLLMTFCQE